MTDLRPSSELQAIGLMLSRLQEKKQDEYYAPFDDAERRGHIEAIWDAAEAQDKTPGELIHGKPQSELEKALNIPRRAARRIGAIELTKLRSLYVPGDARRFAREEVRRNLRLGGDLAPPTRAGFRLADQPTKNVEEELASRKYMALSNAFPRVGYGNKQAGRLQDHLLSLLTKGEPLNISGGGISAEENAKLVEMARQQAKSPQILSLLGAIQAKPEIQEVHAELARRKMGLGQMLNLFVKDKPVSRRDLFRMAAKPLTAKVEAMVPGANPNSVPSLLLRGIGQRLLRLRGPR